MKKNRKHEYLIGIDEVGRGPLAGPVAVGVVKLKVESLKVKTGWGRGFKDSKKLSPKAREGWMVKIEEAKSEGWLEYSVAFVSPSVIDRKGLSHAIRTAVAMALESVDQIEAGPLFGTKVLLDGGLRAPVHYKNQETIIKGDEKELAIALASIVAKVARDKRMVALAKKFPHHGFEKHKGYGTRAHYEALEKHGLTPHHRKSFLKRLLG
jgi:ribonuclease HII